MITNKSFSFLTLTLLAIATANVMASDTSLPKIVDARAPGVAFAGDVFQIYVKVVDDESGYEPEHVKNFNSDFHWVTDSEIKIKLGTAPRFLGNSWFVYNVEVSKFRPTGDYTLNGCIYLRDKADNRGCADLPSPLNVYIVNNSGVVDTDLPKISEAKVNRKKINAGEKFEVLVKITDEGAGYSPKNIKNFNGWFHWETNRDSRLDIGYPPTMLSDGWFSYEVHVPQFRPSGEYTLDACIYVEDKADNFGCAELPTLLSVEVVNKSGIVDADIPQIAEAKISRDNVKAGESFNVLVRIIDQGSGFKPEHIKNFNSWFHWETNRDIGLDIGYPPTVLSDGWFSYKVEVPDQRPSGKYSLNGCIYVSDNAENSGCTPLSETLNVTVVE